MFIRSGKKSKSANLHDLDDHELIQEYQESLNPDIIAILFQRYTHLVYGVSLKYLGDKDDAKDAVMEIFEALLDNLLKHDIQNFKSWLHSVTRNHCLMQLRQKKPVRMDLEVLEDKSDLQVMESPGELHQVDGLLGNFTENDLKTALKALKGTQRQCIELVYLQGKSYQEVCEMTGLSYKAVKSHVQNGKRNLKIKLEALIGKKQ
jgi:RNA polymerase sigma-70 factor (ECF subfamily)